MNRLDDVKCKKSGTDRIPREPPAPWLEAVFDTLARSVASAVRPLSQPGPGVEAADLTARRLAPSLWQEGGS